MNIAVFGLGYVGSVTAVCLAVDGHQVWGVDSDLKRVERLRRGIAPIREPGLDTGLSQALTTGHLTMTSDASEAVAATEIALICVGTPTTIERGTDLSFVVSVVEEIGSALRDLRRPYTILLRSTVPPGTTRDSLLPRLQTAAGRTVGTDLYLYFNPEFLRQGSAMKDFRQAPFTVIGSTDATPPPAATGVDRIYQGVAAPLVVLNYQEAELLKLACNAYHALKIDFANEIGTLAQALGADPSRVMDAFLLDTKLNVSSAYLRPGFPFGGSCLPKDVRSLTYIARQHHLDLPVHESIIRSNDAHLERITSYLLSRNTGTIGMVGLAFKTNTDDLRESAALRLAEKLVKAGKDVLVHEPEISVDLLIGTNLKYLTQALPDFKDRLLDWANLRNRANILLITRDGIAPQHEISNLSIPCLNLSQLQTDFSAL